LPEDDLWRAWSFRISLGGTRYVRYGAHTYALAPGTIFWTSPIYEPVQTYTLAGMRSDVVVLTFSVQRWKHFGEQHPAFREYNAGLLTSYPEQALLALQFAPPQILHVLRQFVALSQSPQVAPLALENQCALLLDLIGELRFGVEVRRDDHEQRRRVEAAQRRIVEALAQSPSLEQVAAELNVSLRQLQRDFLAFTGLTPVRYRNIMRLGEANRLLAETSLPIAEIAARLGYANVTHFSAAFRHDYHSSPREVRDSLYGDMSERDARNGAGISGTAEELGTAAVPPLLAPVP
jgi:AraC-like DNA-binding protein